MSEVYNALYDLARQSQAHQRVGRVPAAGDGNVCWRAVMKRGCGEPLIGQVSCVMLLHRFTLPPSAFEFKQHFEEILNEGNVADHNFKVAPNNVYAPVLDDTS